MIRYLINLKYHTYYEIVILYFAVIYIFVIQMDLVKHCIRSQTTVY